MNTNQFFDVVVVGSGPGGQRAAIAAAKLGARVALVERSPSVGGAWVHTGTIPSKALRASTVHLTGIEQRSVYGQSYRVKDDITVRDLVARTAHVVANEADVVHDQLVRNGVALLSGSASFVDPHTLAVRTERGEQTVGARAIVLAPGTRPARPDSVEFADGVVVDSDTLLALDRVPASLLVVGAGVIGVEYASIFAALGTRVTLVDARDAMLEFCDREIVDALEYRLRDLGVLLRFGEHVTEVLCTPSGALASFESGKRVAADVVLYSAGRQGNTESLALERAGLAADARGRLEVDEHYRTAVPHIYAVGDVIGFPALAATAFEQGRLAACHALGAPVSGPPALIPYGIYTIPQISFVGSTEAELTAARVPYEIGIARTRELAAGQIGGDTHGLLKLLVGVDDGRILGVHLFGAGATDLVHIGQAIMTTGGTIEHLVDTVFNVPTLAEAYKVAALDATNRLHALQQRVTSLAPLRLEVAS